MNAIPVFFYEFIIQFLVFLTLLGIIGFIIGIFWKGKRKLLRNSVLITSFVIALLFATVRALNVLANHHY